MQFVTTALRPNEESPPLHGWADDLDAACKKAEAFKDYPESELMRAVMLQDMESAKREAPCWCCFMETADGGQLPDVVKFYTALNAQVGPQLEKVKADCRKGLLELFQADQILSSADLTARVETIKNKSLHLKHKEDILVQSFLHLGQRFVNLLKKMRDRKSCNPFTKAGFSRTSFDEDVDSFRASTKRVESQFKAAEKNGTLVTSGLTAEGCQHMLDSSSKVLRDIRELHGLEEIQNLQAAVKIAETALAKVPDPTVKEQSFNKHVRAHGEALAKMQKAVEKELQVLLKITPFDDMTTSTQDLVKAGEQLKPNVLSIIMIHTMLIYIRHPNIRNENAKTERENLKQLVEECNAPDSIFNIVPEFLEEAMAILGIKDDKGSAARASTDETPTTGKGKWAKGRGRGK